MPAPVATPPPEYNDHVPDPMLAPKSAPEPVHEPKALQPDPQTKPPKTETHPQPAKAPVPPKTGKEKNSVTAAIFGTVVIVVVLAVLAVYAYLKQHTS